MQLPLQIAFHNMERSETIEETIREKAEKLDAYCDRIMSCRVVVEVPHKHHQHGNLYQVRIDLTVPGDEIVVNREPSLHETYKDVTVAIRDAFDSARRKLEDYVRRMRGDVKADVIPPHARVSKLFPQEGYGFIATSDGREVYFHRHSVLHDAFDRLQVGTEVTFAEEMGKKGPQATTVKLVGKHGHA